MRIGIIGMGVVGTAMANLLGPYAEIVAYDKGKEGRYPAADLAACDLVVICVDTPATPDGSCDLRNIEEAVLRVPNELLLIRSTVVPGTTDQLVRRTNKRICVSPEYVGETPYANSAWPGGESEMPFFIVGGAAATRTQVVDMFLPVLGPDIQFFQCEAVEAELIKYMENSYLAAKVTFVNEWYEICRAYEVDWHRVREGWLLDPRVGRSHSAVFPASRGFGGRCLPKDLLGIIAASRERGYEPRLLAQILNINESFQHRSPAGGTCALPDS